jgi:hypothetical protein
MIFNIGSTFNGLSLAQGNVQYAGNTAYASWGAVQGLGQYAGNGAYVVQQG